MAILQSLLLHLTGTGLPPATSPLRGEERWEAEEERKEGGRGGTSLHIKSDLKSKTQKSTFGPFFFFFYCAEVKSSAIIIILLLHYYYYYCSHAVWNPFFFFEEKQRRKKKNHRKKQHLSQSALLVPTNMLVWPSDCCGSLFKPDKEQTNKQTTTKKQLRNCQSGCKAQKDTTVTITWTHTLPQ